MFYLLYGPDGLGVREAVLALRARLEAEDPLAELNRSELDGRGLSVAALQTAADALPFMGQRRLVVVWGLVAQAGGRREAADELIGYLQRVPPTTRLVLAEGDLPIGNRILKWARGWDGGETGAPVIRHFAPPPPARLPAWLERRAESRGGRLEPSAAAAMSEALIRDGSIDLAVADSELEKLLVFAGDRPVTAEDVALLVTPVTMESVFRLVDALGARDGVTAATLLHRELAAGEQPLRLLSLFGRQFRMLAHARALIDEGASPSTLPAALGVPPFVAGKLSTQARRFAPYALADILRRIADLDAGIKKGRIEAELALDLFVAEVCGVAPAPVTPRRGSLRRGATPRSG